MSKQSAEICGLLVEDLLGELAATIFSTVALRSRLPLRLINELTGLKPKHVKHGLAVLVQQNLVRWTDGPEGAYYEAALDRASRLADYGRYLRVVEARYGKLASQLLEEILVQGSSRFCDLEEWAMARGTEKAPQNGRVEEPVVNGASKGARDSPDGGHRAAQGNRQGGAHGFYDTLRTLRQAGLLLIFHDSFRRPAEDNQQLAMEQIRQQPRFVGGIKGTDERTEYNRRVHELLASWRLGKEVLDDEDEGAKAPKARKRKAETEGASVSQAKRRKSPKKTPVATGSGKANKRSQLSSESGSDIEEAAGRRRARNEEFSDDETDRRPQVNGHVKEDGPSEDPTVLVVNFDKLDVLLRNEALVRQADKFIGPTTARIYETLLHSLVQEVPACRPFFLKKVQLAETHAFELHQHDPTIESSALAKALDAMEDIGTSIATVADDAPLRAPEEFARKPPPRPPEPPKTGKKGKRAAPDDSDSDGAKSRKKPKPIPNDFGDDDDDALPSTSNGHVSALRSTPATDPHYHLRQHLFLLASHRLPFLVHTGASTIPPTPEKWSVPFVPLMRALRTDALCQHTHQRFDDPAPPSQYDPLADASTPDTLADAPAHRIMRLLSTPAFTKLDEKTLAARTLIPPKLLRSCCAALHAAGLLELQDVPRDAGRLAARTLFLWFVDVSRAAARLAEDARAQMRRLVQRRRRERAQRRGLLDKAERLDVVGREAEMLSGREIRRLGEWREREERVWGAVGRLAEAVGLLEAW